MANEVGIGRPEIVELNHVGHVAFSEGRLEAALIAYRACVAALEPGDDPIAPLCYENLGLACYNLGRWNEAIRAFLRALNGDLASRRQSSEFLVVALARARRDQESVRALEAYQATFGAHPSAVIQGPRQPSGGS